MKQHTDHGWTCPKGCKPDHWLATHFYTAECWVDNMTNLIQDTGSIISEDIGGDILCPLCNSYAEWDYGDKGLEALLTDTPPLIDIDNPPYNNPFDLVLASIVLEPNES
jgi:hypothetical protein